MKTLSKFLCTSFLLTAAGSSYAINTSTPFRCSSDSYLREKTPIELTGIYTFNMFSLMLPPIEALSKLKFTVGEDKVFAGEEMIGKDEAFKARKYPNYNRFLIPQEFVSENQTGSYAILFPKTAQPKFTAYLVDSEGDSGSYNKMKCELILSAIDPV